MKGEVKQINGRRVASTEYRSWQMMKNRCLNPRAIDYRYYGGRGIIIDPRWLYFENFLSAMGRKPTLKHTLERIDNSAHYWAGNCCWATRTAQARNRDYVKLDLPSVRLIRQWYRQKRFNQCELAKRFGVSQCTISLITRNESWREEGGA
jgi:DNA-binding XRE family transcriptional regulator